MEGKGSSRSDYEAADRGIPLGITKKDVINIVQLEDRADARAHESSLLALSQVIESKQKTLANMTKMLEIPKISEDHKSCILDDIMHLMQVIQDKENLMEGLYNRKCKAPAVISEFLATATTPVPAVAGAASAVTNPATATNDNVSVAPVANEAMAPHNLFDNQNA